MLTQRIRRAFAGPRNSRAFQKWERSILGVETLEARECPAGWGAYASSLASVSSPGLVKAGDYVTVSVNAGSGK